MRDYRKIKIIYAIVALVIIILLFASYSFGRPNADKINYESRVYFIDQINEKIYITLSFSNYSKADRQVRLLDERIKEFTFISKPNKQQEFLKYFLDRIKEAEKTIGRVKSETQQNQLNKLLAELIIDFIYQKEQNPATNSDNVPTDSTHSKLIEELKKTLNALPEKELSEIKENKGKKIQAIDKNGEISKLIDSKITNKEQPTAEGGTVYYPIHNITRDDIKNIVAKDYQGEYTLKTVNVIRNKGYLCAAVALPESTGALFLIKMTENGLVTEFIEDDWDYANIKDRRPPELTDAEWQWLVWNINLQNSENIFYF